MPTPAKFLADKKSYSGVTNVRNATSRIGGAGWVWKAGASSRSTVLPDRTTVRLADVRRCGLSSATLGR